MKCPNCKKKMDKRFLNELEWGEEGEPEEVWYCEECDETHRFQENQCPKCGHIWRVLE